MNIPIVKAAHHLQFLYPSISIYLALIQISSFEWTGLQEIRIFFL
jgi:hypothetical protein